MAVNDSSIGERIAWTLALAAATTAATALVTKGLEVAWRRATGHPPPRSVTGFAAVGSGLGRKLSRALHL